MTVVTFSGDYRQKLRGQRRPAYGFSGFVYSENFCTFVLSIIIAFISMATAVKTQSNVLEVLD